MPGVVLIHDTGGLDDHAVQVARRFAAEGFAVLAPDLYAREGKPTPDALPDRRALADLDAAAATLGAREDVDADRVAAVGFGAGGCLAFLLGCTSTRIAAVVDFYGGVVYPELSANKTTQPLELVLNLGCPFLGHFGEEDSSIPRDDVERMRGVLSQFAKNFDIFLYPGAGHSFFDDRSSDHHPAAAAEAWQRTLAFLSESLS